MTAAANTLEPGHDWLLTEESELSLRFRLAREAQVSWAHVPVVERARRIGRAASLLSDELDDWVELICDENGKPPVEAVGHDVGAAISSLRFVCDNAATLLAAERVGLAWMPNRRATITREPIGLALVISPWNFPLSIPLSQVGAGLVAGNAVALKPSEVTPRVGEAIKHLLDRCELPTNLFTLFSGDGALGAALVRERPDKVFFTGSVPTGRKVMAAAAAHPIPVNLELGGVDAAIVCEDADVELASSAVLWGSMMNTGQVCASVERLLVHRSIYDAFMGRLRAKLGELDHRRDLGRVTLDRQAQVYARHLDDARARGLEVTGGEYLAPGTLSPTIIEGPDIEGAAVYREESFGPLLAVTRFSDDAHAVALHNASPMGLTASVFTRSSARAEAMAAQLHAGVVSHNDIAGTLYALAELPWGGGAHQSGFGRSHGREGLLEFTQAKVFERNRWNMGGMGGMLDFKRPWWFPYDARQLEFIRAYTQALGSSSIGQRTLNLVRAGKAAARMLVDSPRI